MTITSDDPEEIEEERRLCYVGMTRAMRNLTLTSAKVRMIRGQTQYNKVSRFVKEIDKALLSEMLPKEKLPIYQEAPTFGLANKSFRTPVSYHQPIDFGSKADASSTLSYGVGDRVSHVKFGAGTVANIVAGGKDYEVTVDFDRVGTKKLFSVFAKLTKC
jgi:DNA helicase-2/ATP-dependent DNA helicase PcrA